MTRPTAPAPLTLPACPAWCTRAGRHTAGDMENGRRTVTAEEVRRLAGAVTQAAAWMEGNA